MEKFVAFGLYQKNEQAAFQPAGEATLQQEVYLAKDVHTLLKNISDARLLWSMECHCVCPACNHLDERLRGLMGS
jgi:hypothetical protein